MSCRRTFLPFALVAACLLSGRPAAAQVTTGALSGTITDQSGAVLPGASVEATHVPTGTRYTAVSGTDGRYLILNVRAGGPYSGQVGVGIAFNGSLSMAPGGTIASFSWDFGDGTGDFGDKPTHFTISIKIVHCIQFLRDPHNRVPVERKGLIIE